MWVHGGADIPIRPPMKVAKTAEHWGGSTRVEAVSEYFDFLYNHFAKCSDSESCSLCGTFREVVDLLMKPFR